MIIYVVQNENRDIEYVFDNEELAIKCIATDYSGIFDEEIYKHIKENHITKCNGWTYKWFELKSNLPF